MAESPERSINQPLSRKAKDRIGSFYLSRLINWYSFPHERSDWLEFNHMRQYEILSGSQFTPLMETLKLTDLKWYSLDFPPSLLFVGRKPDNDFTTKKSMKPDINQADATIEIASQAARVDRGWPTGWKDEFTPFHVRIAGVSQARNRIVAATYDLTENNRLVNANVSISSAEFDKQNNIDMLYLLSKSIIPLARSEGNPYFTAGLITPQMRKVTKACDPNDSEHEFAFSFELTSPNPKDGISINRPDVDPKSATEARNIFSRLGYYAKRENGLVSIGLGINEAEARGVEPWKIVLPEALPKA